MLHVTKHMNVFLDRVHDRNSSFVGGGGESFTAPRLTGKKKIGLRHHVLRVSGVRRAESMTSLFYSHSSNANKY